MDAGGAARHFRGLQIQLRQSPRPAERHTMWYNFGNYSPLVCGTRRQWLWVQQERLRSSCSSTVTPGGKDAVTGSDARGKVCHIMEGRALRSHNYTGK